MSTHSSMPLALPERAQADLRAIFERARLAATSHGSPVLASIAFEIEPLHPLELFAELDDGHVPCIFWESAEPRMGMLGWNCSRALSASGASRFADVDRDWQALLQSAVGQGPLGPRLLGGFRFDTESARDACWEAFPDAAMYLPELLVIRAAEQCWLLCQGLVRENEETAALAERYWREIGELHRASVAPASRGGSDKTPDLLDTQAIPALAWQAKAARAVDCIRDRLFDKVVLAHRTQLSYSAPPSPARLLRGLRGSDQRSHLFAFRQAHKCFLGATPERLVRVCRNRIETHALAGSAPRHADPHIDQQIGQTLLNNSKERHEHALVVDAIRDKLVPMALELDIPLTPSLHRLPGIQHLSTPLTGTLKKGNGILNLVASLHPTPAVAGHPRDTALAYLRAHEGFDRGWYAAPLGWISAEGDGDFLVALRCALLDDRDCCLFAGCGIVGDSDPAREYQEICLKLAKMRSVLPHAKQIA